VPTLTVGNANIELEDWQYQRVIAHQLSPYLIFLIQYKLSQVDDTELLAALLYAEYRGPAMLSIAAEMHWLRLHMLVGLPLEDAIKYAGSLAPTAAELEDYKIKLVHKLDFDASRTWMGITVLDEIGPNGLYLYTLFAMGAPRVCVKDIRDPLFAAIHLNPRHISTGFDDLDIVKLTGNIAFTYYIPDHLYQKIFRMRKFLLAEAGLVKPRDIRHWHPKIQFGFTKVQLDALRQLNDFYQNVLDDTNDHFIVDVPDHVKHARCVMIVDKDGVERIITS